MLGKSVIMQIITYESNHKKYDDTSKEKIKNQNEDSQKKVTKGVRRMPWLSEAKKGVTSCDKLRVLANTNQSADTRMGQPIPIYRDIPCKWKANVGN